MYGVNSNASLNRNDYLYLNVADLVIYFGITVPNRTDHAFKIYVREVICFYSYFSVNRVNLYNIID